jgi:citrate lyase subunit beta/citryl-CoA lyase
VGRLAASGADGGVLDLEDAVAASEKAAARGMVRDALASLGGLIRCVRVNALDTGMTADDVAASVCAELDALVLPKAESADDIARLEEMIASAEAASGVAAGRVKVIATIESAAGIVAAAGICAHRGRLARIALGSVDLGADLGLPTIRGDLSPALAYGRAKIVYDARAAGLPAPLDGPFLRIRDAEGMAADCAASRALGFGGRICIHPDQVAPANRAYAPEADEVAFAARVVAAFAEAERSGTAAIAVDGVFVDYPVLRKAERIVAMAAAIAARPAPGALAPPAAPIPVKGASS